MSQLSTKAEEPQTVIADIPSLEERLIRIRRALHLAHSAASRLADKEPKSDVYEYELFEAMNSLLHKAKEDMYWIDLLPKVVQGVPTPDDDQVDEASGETREIIVSEYLRAAIANTAGAR